MKLNKLEDFASPIILAEDRDYTWIIETRTIDEAGTPTSEWEVWSAFLADNKKFPMYPQKNTILAGYLKEIRDYFFSIEKSIEYRIKLACRLTQELDVAATDPWSYIHE